MPSFARLSKGRGSETTVQVRGGKEIFKVCYSRLG